MDYINVAFIFVSFCYPSGATSKMLKAVLKKSREGGKGNKKDSGMNINTVFYNVDELCRVNPALEHVLLEQQCPGRGAAAGSSCWALGQGRSRSRSEAAREAVPCPRP